MNKTDLWFIFQFQSNVIMLNCYLVSLNFQFLFIRNHLCAPSPVHIRWLVQHGLWWDSLFPIWRLLEGILSSQILCSLQNMRCLPKKELSLRRPLEIRTWRSHQLLQKKYLEIFYKNKRMKKITFFYFLFLLFSLM